MPDYLKYWVFRSVIGLSEYDKDKNEFPKRSKGTLKQFPDINHEALAYVVDAVHKKQGREPHEFEYDIQPEEREEFQRHLVAENFAKLYAWAVELINPIPEHLLPVTEGEWKKYDRGSDFKLLSQSIRGKGTGWCTAGQRTAKNQLAVGDFYVYYSLDDDKRPTIPRIAIRMEGNKIAEVRGVAYKQNLDPYMGDVLAEKLGEFPDKDQYLKKESDMKTLTAIENKVKAGQELTRDDLIFLYEIDEEIGGFGYKEDPRINELRGLRNPETDAPTVFGCTPDQIAHSVGEINQDTKAYVGKLEREVIARLGNIKYVYTFFPEERVGRKKLEIGRETALQIQTALMKNGVRTSTSSERMMFERGFESSGGVREVDLVQLRVKDLGFDFSPTVSEFYRRAAELGLNLCPAEVGPWYRMNYLTQPEGSLIDIAMKHISVSGGTPCVFELRRRNGFFELGSIPASSLSKLNLEGEWIFCLPERS